MPLFIRNVMLHLKLGLAPDGAFLTHLDGTWLWIGSWKEGSTYEIWNIPQNLLSENEKKRT